MSKKIMRFSDGNTDYSKWSDWFKHEGTVVSGTATLSEEVDSE